MFKFQKITFLFTLLLLAGSIAFTSCSDDEMPDPDPNPEELCDSFFVSIVTDSMFLTAVANGGTSPYAYLWSDGSVSEAIDFQFGSVSVTVTDANGCVGSITVDTGEMPSDCSDFSASIIEENGTLTGVVSGGSAPFNMQWIGPDSTVVNGESIDLTVGGDYTFWVTDAEGCSGTVSYTYENNDPCAGFYTEIEVTPDTLAQMGSILHAYVFNGTAPYAYIWNEGSTESILYEVETGTYSVTVTDANGCVAVDEAVVE